MMGRIWLVAILFWGAILLGSCAQKAPEGIEWASSLTDALQTAQQQDRHIIADFWSEA